MAAEPRAAERIRVGEFAPLPGIRLGVASAGIRQRVRPDLLVVECAAGSCGVGMFTRNDFAAAPVLVARRHLQTAGGAVRALLFNSGNANAGLGEPGLADALRCCESLAEALQLPVSAILPFSTGVIGERLPIQRIIGALPQALEALKEDAWHGAAESIMTTDTRPKGVSLQWPLPDGGSLRMTGIAKGAGMVHPNMATMLALVATDLAVPQPLLQTVLAAAVEHSFHRITIDGDTSTNDACMLVATGCGASWDDRYMPVLSSATAAICGSLAAQIVEDAEGVRRTFRVAVNGGRNSAECLAVAQAVANSPLVKTAVHAGDPNWGRILAAVGAAGIEQLDTQRVSIAIGELAVFSCGVPAAEYSEEQGQQQMAGPSPEIRIELDRGTARETLHAADLSAEYVRINAEYRS